MSAHSHALRCRTRPGPLIAGLACAVFGTTLAAPREAAAGVGIARLGSLGDSLSDESFDQSYGAYAKNWPVLLVDLRSVDFGPTATDAGQPGGTWGEPRRTGYEDDWSRAGATTGSAISSGASAGLAEGAASRGVSHAVILLGSIDFGPGAGVYDEIYAGSMSDAAIDDFIAARIADLQAILDQLHPTGVKLVVASAPDLGATPAVQAAFTLAVNRERVSTALARFRDAVRDLATTNGDVFLDQFELQRTIFGSNLSPNSTLLVGNVPIDLHAAAASSGSAVAFVADGVHPHSALQAISANLVLRALDGQLGGCTPPFSEGEMLVAQGLEYGGADTLDAALGALDDFVASPSGAPLLADGFECGALVAWSAAAKGGT